MFGIYVIWMAVIFMNILVGLTVSKIDQLVKRGGIIQAEKRVDDIVAMNRLYTSKMVKILTKCCKIFQPEKIMSDDFTKVCRYNFCNFP